MRERKRAGRKHHTGLLAFIVIVAIFVGVAFLVSSPSPHNTPSQQTRAEDAFFGNIANVAFQGRTTGVVKADTNCKPVQNGLTNCIGIIIADDGTELHFNYTHDMSKQACLSPGDHVTIMLLNDGTVKVVRG